jgi:hypothetical protein
MVTTVRPVRLPKFTGATGEDLDSFLAQMELRFADYGASDDEKKIRVVLSGLKEEAFRWFTVYVNEYSGRCFKIGHDTTNPSVGVWKDFNEFITYLKKCHGRHDDPKEKARNEFLVIKQGRASAMQYNQEFARKTALIGSDFNDTLQTLIYKRGLSEGLRNRLTTLPGARKWTLKDWMQNAVDYEFNQQIQEVPREYKPNVYKNQVSYDEYRGEPMDVDDFGRHFRKRPKKFWNKGKRGKFQPRRIVVRKEQEIKPKEVDQQKRFVRKGAPRFKAKGKGKPFRENKPGKQCYRCGQMGHWQRDCKVKINQNVQEVEIAECELLERKFEQDFCMREGKGALSQEVKTA